MWWDGYVPRKAAEEQIAEVTQQLTGEIDRLKYEIAVRDCRLSEIEESAGWKLVLWCRRLFARIFPPNSALGTVNRLARRSFHAVLDRRAKNLSQTGSGQTPLRQPLPTSASPVAPASDIDATAPAARPYRVAVYNSSTGNYFFDEMRDLLAAGLRELGLHVSIRSETDGFDPSDHWHIVIAPHEFFYLGQGVQLAAGELPSNLILVNTEQPSTQWFQLAAQFFPRARALWDVDYLSSQRLRNRGWQCSYLPLGYVADFQPFQATRELPRHHGTCFLEPHVRRAPDGTEALAGRPIDLAFFGNPTPRRQAFFSGAASVLSRYRCYIHFSDGSRPLLPGKTTFMNTQTVMGLVRRSKILLNIHRDTDPYFEWQRVVMQGLWQKTLVISEPCSPAPPFRADLDYVEAALDDIPALVNYYLANARGRNEAQEIASRGFRTLSRECRIRDLLRPLAEELIGPQSLRLPPRVVDASNRSAA
jgi:hypothetical protein